LYNNHLNKGITEEILNELFDNILKDCKPIFHPKQIIFVTNLPEEYGQLGESPMDEGMKRAGSRGTFLSTNTNELEATKHQILYFNRHLLITYELN
jgi:hypothetical protein